MQELVLPNGSKTGYSYDALERLVSVANKKSDTSNISTYGYGFDDVNKKDTRQWVEKQVGADPLKHIDYVYDSIDQLKREVSTEPTPTYDLSYDYHKMGNRTAKTDGPGSWSYSYTANKLNQITQVASTHPTLPATNTTLQYDPNGNLTGNGNTQYQYDDYDRLTAIIQPTALGENLQRSYFSYDGFNRRVQVVEQSWDIATNTWNTDSATRYIYDGMDVVQERNAGDNVITAKYVRSGNIGGLLARIEPAVGVTPEKQSFYHYDGSGNVTELTDSSEAVVAKYDYDAYGRILSSSGTEANQPYRYSTKWLHSRSGLYDYGYRFYSPGMGRWINRDPLQESGGVNLYHFVGNNPSNRLDSYGLEDLDHNGQPDPGCISTCASDGDNGDNPNDNNVPVCTGALMGRGGSGGGGFKLPSLPSLNPFKWFGGPKAWWPWKGGGKGPGGGNPVPSANPAPGASPAPAADPWRRDPLSIMDQLVMEAAKKGAGDPVIRGLSDARYRGMDKYSYSVKSSNGLRSEVHYVVDPYTGFMMDFKIKHSSTDKIGLYEKSK